ncbi:FliM/FliN family flagellar motor switch protein [Ralstonia mojiangensis]|uniref:FliM/FliN family flagellar motor switch protein n=1 Tax=Ralstonia mojiangensis TaxID=2953895 RepID=UPI00209014C0|nr:FliM/FliN family flagellar motor switch protein [Ralstonia mojiangensis]MCO5413480.1 FliM/FliN family flagellar motor switch protein [Ralstonia mojiangensis]
MSRDLKLRQVDPAMIEMRNSILAARLQGVRATRLSAGTDYISLEAECGAQTLRVFVPLQQLVDFWLGDASIPAEQVDRDLAELLVVDAFSAQGLPSPSEEFLWRHVCGFAQKDDFATPKALIYTGPFDLYLEALPRLFHIPAPLHPTLPVDVQWLLGKVVLPASAIAGISRGDVLRLPPEAGVLSSGATSLFSFHFFGDYLMLDERQNTNDDASRCDGESEIMPAASTVLDDLPVTITFVLSKRTMSVGDIAALQEGMTIPLAHFTPQVDLVAGGVRLAQGELVRIGESFGVEIMKTPNESGVGS